MISRRILVLWLLLIAPSAVDGADEPVPASPRRVRESVSVETDSDVMKQFEAARNAIANGQWSQAVDLLTEIIETKGDVLNPVSPGRYLKSRLYANLLLASLPADGRAVYRKAVDPQAKQWLLTGRQESDESQLRKIVEDAFNSSYGDDALFLLGEREWERGAIDSAAAHWLQILPPANETAAAGQVTTLQYPDSDLNFGEVAARLVLCSLVRGDWPRAEREIAAFRELYPDAKGSLGRRSGSLVDIVAELAVEARDWPANSADRDFATFAFNSQRNTVLPQPVDVGAVEWFRELPRPHASAARTRQVFGTTGVLAYHPATYGEIVLANSSDSVFAWNLKTGKSAWPGGDNDNGLIYPTAADSQESLAFGPVRGVAHHTMTISDGRLYARLGTPITETSEVEELRALPSHLVCLDLAQGEGKLLWKTPARSVAPGWTFAGSPVVADGRVFVVLRHGRPQTEILVACYTAESGDLVWSRRVCTAIAHVEQPDSLIHNHLLTLSDDSLFLSTDVGAIASLDARDGAIRWVVTYESRPMDDSSAGARRLGGAPSPPLFYRGLVIAAPHDHDAVLAIEASTGVVVWQRELKGAIDHLIAVREENLVVSGHRLWGLDVYSGSTRWAVGSADPATFGYGRGLLAGDSVFWPKRDEIFIVDYRSGQVTRRIPLTDVHGVGGGNLLIANGLMVVAEPHRIVAFGPHSRLKTSTNDISANDP